MAYPQWIDKSGSCQIWSIVGQIYFVERRMYPTTRILQDQSCSFFSSVTLRGPPSISGTESGIIDPPVSKWPEKILSIKNKKNLKQILKKMAFF